MPGSRVASFSKPEIHVMNQVDPEIKALQHEIFLSKVGQACRTPMSQRLADGAILFDQSMKAMRGAIRSQNPEFTPEQVEREVRRRRRIAKLLSDRDLYVDAGIIDE
ncbi:MAG: hypothetical protein R3C19_08775 [Planctomycetaceae bacterium]